MQRRSLCSRCKPETSNNSPTANPSHCCYKDSGTGWPITRPSSIGAGIPSITFGGIRLSSPALFCSQQQDIRRCKNCQKHHASPQHWKDTYTVLFGRKCSLGTTRVYISVKLACFGLAFWPSHGPGRTTWAGLYSVKQVSVVE